MIEDALPSPRSIFPSPHQRSLVLLLFVLGGAAALIYEIAWFQLIQFVIGSSAVSLGVLLGTFMGGMCLGSLLAPRLISTDRHPLRVYAVLELAIAVAGLAMPFAMPLVSRVYVAWVGEGAAGLLLRGLVTSICLLPATVAMGATLPILARWVEATPRGAAWLGRFYAANTAGAVIGCLVAGFYLLRVFDVVVASAVAVVLNIVVALVALRLASTSPHHPISPSPNQPISPSLHPVHVAIALSGFCAMAGEVIWTRTLGLLFGATVYTFAIVLAIFLIGLGLGSAVAAASSRTPGAARRALGWCQLLAVLAIAWTAHSLMRQLPYWPSAYSLSTDIWVLFRIDVLRACWAIGLAPMLWGASVPLALAAVSGRDEDPARGVARVYGANTLGAIAGALASSLLLVAWVGSQRTQQLMILLSAVAALSAWSVGRVRPDPAAGPKDPPYLSIVIASALAMAALLAATIPPLPGLLVAYGRYTAAWAGHTGDIIYVGEGMSSTVAVSRSADGVLNYHNAGKIQASSRPQDMRLQRMLGHLTTLVPPNPRSVLVIGCGAGVTAGAVSVNPRVERVTIAEIEPLVPRVVSTYFSGANADVLRNPKTRLVIDDARHYLLTTKEKFDAITSDPLDPWVKGAATLYTREFFDLVKAHLNPGGVVTLFVQLYESSPEAVKSEVGTFFEAFPNGVVWGNTFDGQAADLVLMGSVEPLELDLDWMEWGWRRPEYAAVRRSLGEVNIRSIVDLLGNYGGRAQDLRPWLAGAAINRDRDLRLQYLAGLGLNLHEGRRIYGEMLTYRRFPADIFNGSEQLLWDLRAAIEGPKE